MKGRDSLFLALNLIVLALSRPASAQSIQRLTLRDAESIALSNHPQIQSARFSALAEGQVTREVRSAYFPTPLAPSQALALSRAAASPPVF